MSEPIRSGLRAPALEPLLVGLVDYAGTFPPAGLDLEAAAANFAGYRRSKWAWVLGRAAVAQGDLSSLAAWVREHDAGSAPWPITAVVGERFDRTADLVAAAAEQDPADDGLAGAGPALDVQAFECRVASAADVTAAARALAPLVAAPTDVVVEVAADRPDDWAPLLDAIAAVGARAKLRTGAVVAAAIPPADVVARFLVACAARRLPVKLTAGLHHALCATRALTYEPAGPIGPMHGFVNAYAAAGLAFEHGADVATVERCLLAPDARSFRATSAGLSVELDGRAPAVLTTDQLRELRGRFISAFGSCSFDEPLEDLCALGWLEHPARTPGT
ncbi:hypothetical protein Pla163_25280 [Planctomycetes bacterium Pla163]|uniref:Uncharacterized protein n=1 Tax=Rohdeia mirabilis TaxID=2528008 RepID=A0A518D1S6_9BACT|nr:hypothetical protein Pla163_25280 [Planctomycetes bacterium Pla163]